MEQLTVKIKGSAVLMHSERLANPLDPASRALKSATKVKNKTEEHYEEIAMAEMLGGLYHDSELGPYIPDTWLHACIKEGARLTKKGRNVERGVLFPNDKFALEYKGPRDAQTIAKSPAFRDMRTVRNQQNRVLRTRPVFRDWSCTFSLMFDPGQVDRAELETIIDSAGRYIGIGDYRPRFGRFEATFI